MSASLVGSEMCIRDRAPGQPNRRSAAGHQRGQPARMRPVRVQSGAGAPPVSYTHLTLPTICSV
eukprot:10774605-Alexandrium_andersonii.AAC.1